MSSHPTFWDELRNRDFAYAFFDEFLNTKIATQIKTLREQRGLKQRELADLVPMAQERICILENVNYSSWTINTLRKLARAFGVRLNVSFETFGSGIKEVQNFKRENLECISLDDELDAMDQFEARAIGEPAPQGAGGALGAVSGNETNRSAPVQDNARPFEIESLTVKQERDDRPRWDSSNNNTPPVRRAAYVGTRI